MSQERFQLTSAAHLLFINEGKILLARRYNTGYEDGNYSVVAGHLNGHETLRQAAVREAQEEAGLSLKIEDLSVVHVMHRNKGDEEKIDFFVKVKQWEGEPVNTEPDKCDEIAWFSLENLPSNMVPYVRHAIECIQKGELYSEFGF